MRARAALHTRDRGGADECTLLEVMSLAQARRSLGVLLVLPAESAGAALHNTEEIGSRLGQSRPFPARVGWECPPVRAGAGFGAGTPRPSCPSPMVQLPGLK